MKGAAAAAVTTIRPETWPCIPKPFWLSWIGGVGEFSTRESFDVSQESYPEVQAQVDGPVCNQKKRFRLDVEVDHEVPACEVCDEEFYGLACWKCGLRICARCARNGATCMCGMEECEPACAAKEMWEQFSEGDDPGEATV